MATLYEETQRFRRALLDKDRQAAARMAVAYSRAYRDLAADLDRVVARIQAMRDEGMPDARIRSAIYSEQRTRVLLDKVRDQVARFAGQADVIIGGSTEAASVLGKEAAAALIDVALPEGISASPVVPAPGQQGQAALMPQTVNVPTRAAERLVTPTTLLQGLAPAAQEAVAGALVSGIAAGKSPRVIARGVRDALGGNLTRALTIARTETLRAYREASREVYLENASVVEAQQWICALDRRSCAACIALHGKIIPLDEPLPAHPNCRCTVAPLVTGGPRVSPGTRWFRDQPADIQREILGPAKYDAYRSRQITLPDLVHTRTSPVWGDSAGVASLSQAEANAAARRAS